MQYIALNGFRHPLNRYFNDKVQCVNEFDWNTRTISRLSNLIKTPTVLIGFSDGATAVLHIAAVNPHIVIAYAHSPMMPARLPQWSQTLFRLFRTMGDTTPTFKETEKVFHLMQEQNISVEMSSLQPLPALPIRDFATLVMAWKKHQFHNCIPCLPQELISETFR